MFGDINHKERVSYLVSTILNLPYEEVKEDILDTMEEYSSDEDFSYLYYDAEQDRKALENGLISEAKEEARKETEKKTKQEIAKSLLQENLDIEIISKCTGLTKEEIEEL